jgi:hypothetical protein
MNKQSLLDLLKEKVQEKKTISKIKENENSK